MHHDDLVALQQDVLDRIDRERDLLTDFLARYVRIPSVNPGRAPEGEPGETRTCQEWLAGELAGWSVFDRIDVWADDPAQPNVAAVVAGAGGDGRALMCNGHTDTVGVSADQLAQRIGSPRGTQVRATVCYVLLAHGEVWRDAVRPRRQAVS